MRTSTDLLALAGAAVFSILSAQAQPIITLQPTNQSVSLGASVTFRVSATSTNPPILFQWQRAGTNLLSAAKSTLTFTNIQSPDAGDYDAVLTDGSGSVTSALARLEVDPTFTKITTGDVVDTVGTGVACAWGDYDDDGFIDLFVTCAADPVTGALQRNLLFHNNGNGTFTRVTTGVPATDTGDWRGCAWADYDNDGHVDLLATKVDGSGFPDQAVLYHNKGNGTFTRMKASILGSSVPGGNSEGCVWGDYDNDGFLDVYIARYGTDLLLHNNGDGTFTRLSSSVGVPPDARDGYTAMWGDYDSDGWPDLFVTAKDEAFANQTNVLYHNNRDGTFTRIFGGPIVTDNDYSGGGVWADYDNDGHLDLFVVNGLNYLGTNRLYHNNGDGTFTKMTTTAVGSLVSDTAAFSSCAWGDYDNDGFIDVFIAAFGLGNGVGTNYLYHNNGDGSFTRILSGSLVNDSGQAAGCAWGDYDNDGFLDLFVARGADFLRSENLLYRNNGNSNAWLKVNLLGRVSNRSGIGAKVLVESTIRGKATRQLREIHTGDGGAGSALIAHFGLGDATNIDQVRIEWPSGIVQTMTNVPPRQHLTVVEHQQFPPGPIGLAASEISTNGSITLTATSNPGMLYMFEASTNLIDWAKIAVRSNATGSAQFVDSKTTGFTHRFYRASAP